MRLVDWAKQQGIGYRTAYNWHRAGKMPVRTTVTATGMILVEDSDIFAEQNRCPTGLSLKGRRKLIQEDVK